MRAESFLDTNVLVYAAGGRGSEESKREKALTLIASFPCVAVDASRVKIAAAVSEQFESRIGMEPFSLLRSCCVPRGFTRKI